ncbi:hypothetical protein YA35_09325 [Klebsiella aerogenes]|nr:hypothetical protein SR89_18845 [Klebsiella aerogenes]KLF56262.1 hypothetical protein YA35_09325 [Klebsiella aerogenes]
MCFCINLKRQISPDTTALLAVLIDFLLIFTEDLHACGTNKALSCSQGQPEYAFNRQDGCDG